jgi:hypothetical protein
MPVFVDIHFPVQIEGLNQGMRHCDSSRLHGMVLIIVEFSNFLIEEIGNLIGHFNKYRFIYFYTSHIKLVCSILS